MTTLPLTPIQHGMLLAHSTGGGSHYLQQQIVSFQGPVDQGLLERAWQLLQQRHSVLQIRFRRDETGNWTQYRDAGLRMELKLGKCSADELEIALDEDRAGGFPPPFADQRLHLWQLRPGRQVMVWTYHHALLDGRSRTRLLRELLEIYDALKAGRKPGGQVAPNVEDFLNWYAKQSWDQSAHFWRRQSGGMHGVETVFPQLPMRRASKCGTRDYLYHSPTWFPLPADHLDRHCRAHGFTTGTLSLVAFSLNVGDYLGKDRVIVGSVRSCQYNLPASLQGVAGLVINTVPVSVSADPDRPVGEVLVEARNFLLQLRGYEITPWSSIRDYCRLEPGASLFSVLHSHERSLRAPLQDSVDTGEKRSLRSIQGRIDSTLGAETIETDHALRLGIQFDPARLGIDDAAGFAHRYGDYVRCILDEPAARVDAIRCRVSAQERARLRFPAKTTRVPQSGGSVLGLFLNVAECRPVHPAVVHDKAHLSYGELAAAAGEIADWCRQAGISDAVGIYLPAGAAFCAVFLGVLMAGRYAVPLDITAPGARTGFIVEDCEIDCVITDVPHQGTWTRAMAGRGCTVRTLVVNERQPFLSPSSVRCTGSDVGHRGLQVPLPGGRTYAVHTSGSTGKPKGVAITNANLMPLLRWQQEHFCLDSSTRMVQTLPVSFDFGLQEILTVLPFGGTLFVPDPHVLSHPVKLVDFINVNGVNMLYSTPSMMRVLVDVGVDMPGLERILLGGERLDWPLLEALRRRVRKSCAIFNGYGPTEATINCAMYEAPVFDIPRRDSLSVPIGRATGAATLHVLGPNQRRVPRGVTGELYIGGPGVASGYLKAVEASESAFISQGVSELDCGRVYRTGDRVRELHDGCLEFMGRTDAQVKLRGYRVELEEVENCIRGIPGIKDAACRVDYPDGRAEKLIAFVVSNSPVTSSAARRALADQLPGYMLPAEFIVVPQLPITANGKLDRAALGSITLDVVTGAIGAQWYYEGVWQVDQKSGRAEARNAAGPILIGRTALLARLAKCRPDAVLLESGEVASALSPELELRSSRNTRGVDVIFDLREFACSLSGCDEGGYLRLVLAVFSRLIEGAKRGPGIRLLILVDWLHCIDSSGALNPRHALTLGLCRTLNHESESVSWIMADMDGSTDLSERRLLRDMDEILADLPGGTLLGYRDGNRYRLSYRNTRQPMGYEHRSLAGQSWLVLGGFGGIGRVLTDTLVASGVSRLALMDAKVPQKAVDLTDRGFGTECGNSPEYHFIDIDITDQPGFRQALEQALDRIGVFDGVIHAAGNVDSWPLQRLTPERITRVLGPKYNSLWTLADVLERSESTRVILCSSIDAIQGKRHHASYCAANAFMDAFAEYQNQRGRPWQSINWEIWRESGMAARVQLSSELRDYRRRLLANGLSDEDGARVFRDVIASGKCRTIVSTLDLQERLKTRAHPGLSNDVPIAGAGSSMPDPGEGGKSLPVLREIVCRRLATQCVGDEESLMDMGVDSITAMQLVMEIDVRMGVSLSVADILGTQSLSDLGELVDAHNQASA